MAKTIAGCGGIIAKPRLSKIALALQTTLMHRGLGQEGVTRWKVAMKNLSAYR